MFNPPRSNFEKFIQAATPALLAAVAGTGRVVEDQAGLHRGSLHKAVRSATSSAADRLSHAVRRGSPLDRLSSAISPRRRGPSLATIGLLGAAAIAIGYFVFVDDPRS